MNHFQGGSILPLNQQGVIAIDSAMKGYLAVIKKRNPIPSDSIQKLEAIRLKLAPLTRPGGFSEGTVLVLSHNELRLIAEAIDGFIGSTRLIIPPSVQRDVALHELARLREYIQAYFTHDMN